VARDARFALQSPAVEADVAVKIAKGSKVFAKIILIDFKPHGSAEEGGGRGHEGDDSPGSLFQRLAILFLRHAAAPKPILF